MTMIGRSRAASTHAAIQSGERAPVSALRPLLDYPELRPVLICGDQPVMRWMFGTDQPELLLGAIEEAMVAARVPGAQGFAARALGTPYDRPPKDIPADPRLW